MPPNLRSVVAQGWRSIGTRRNFSSSPLSNGNTSRKIQPAEVGSDARYKDEAISRMRAAAASKRFGQEEKLYSLVADACFQVCPKNRSNFNVDNVHVFKLLGGGLHDSLVVRGLVLKSIDALSCIKKMDKAQVAVYVSGVDVTATETQGSAVLIPKDAQKYAETEAGAFVTNSEAKVIVSGVPIRGPALDFLNQHNIMAVTITSESELSLFCKTVGAKSHLKPTPDNLGYIDSISVEEIGGVSVLIAKTEKAGNSISTVVLRGSSVSILDDLEMAVHDGVKAFMAMCRDSQILPLAAATKTDLDKNAKCLPTTDPSAALNQMETTLQRLAKAVEQITAIENPLVAILTVVISVVLYYSADYVISVYITDPWEEKMMENWRKEKRETRREAKEEEKKDEELAEVEEKKKMVEQNEKRQKKMEKDEIMKKKMVSDLQESWTETTVGYVAILVCVGVALCFKI